MTLDAKLDSCPVFGDPALLSRLIANLIENALRYNICAGRVDIATNSEEGHSVLTVRNTGPVLAPENIDRLTEPFHREGAVRTDTRGGLGLGLSIVKAITTAHRGRLEIRAQPTGGLWIGITFISPSTADKEPGESTTPQP